MFELLTLENVYSTSHRADIYEAQALVYHHYKRCAYRVYVYRIYVTIRGDKGRAAAWHLH